MTEPIPVIPNTAARRMLQLAGKLGVRYIFVNLGSDHPAFIEAFTALEDAGAEMPEIIICPHEMTALSAAHGYAMVARRAQMVLVHVDVGTQNLGCSIHNAARTRVPALIMAGLSPITVNGERPGSRTEYIHYTQDSTRQHEIGGQYMKWSYELRAGEMAEQVLLRGLQLSQAEPQGPVYITGAREVWEESSVATDSTPAFWPPPELGQLSAEDLHFLHTAIQNAQRPLLVTSYLGRDPDNVRRLVDISEALDLPVLEVSPHYMNFPGDHPNHAGYRRNAHVANADLIIMLDVDVPWLFSKTQPASGSRLFHLDLDPIKADMGFWHFPAEKSWCISSKLFLSQWRELLKNTTTLTSQHRKAWIERIRDTRQGDVLPTKEKENSIDAQDLCLAVKALLDEHSVVVLEAPTLSERLLSTLQLHKPGSYFANGGSGLGWGINAAIGIKLAKPEADVITITGDGSYLFGVPSSAFWVSQTYGAPTLTIINNNSGWNAPKQSTLLVHPNGIAKQQDRFWVTSGAGARYADIAAAASGAGAFKVSHCHTLLPTLKEALAMVRSGRSAVVDVVTSPISKQRVG